MKTYALALAMVCVVSVLYAQESDPTDISDIVSEFEEIGLPTAEFVEDLATRANDAFESEEWEEAAEAYDQLSRSANWLANLIRSGLEPFYSASYDERDEFPYSKLRPLIPIEDMSNNYVQMRNDAMVNRALSLIQMGQDREAASLLYRALDLIDIDSEELWAEARQALFSLIGVEL